MAPRLMLQLMQMMFTLVRNLFADKADLVIENLALRQQVAALKRERPRPRLNDMDRLFWVAYLIHDRDTRFTGIGEWLKSAGAKSVLTSYRSPWQNGICERFFLSLRTDLLDHVIVFNEAHVRRLITEYLGYYHEDRCHLSLNKDSPDSRPVQQRPSPSAEVIAIPRVGGIHHRYEWRDAA